MKRTLPPISELVHRASAVLTPDLRAWRRRRRSLLAASPLANAATRPCTPRPIVTTSSNDRPSPKATGWLSREGA